MHELNPEKVQETYDIILRSKGIQVTFPRLPEKKYNGGQIILTLGERVVPVIDTERKVPIIMSRITAHKDEVTGVNSDESLSLFMTMIGMVDYWVEWLWKANSINPVYHIVRANEQSRNLMEIQLSLGIYNQISTVTSGLESAELYKGGIYVARFPHDKQLHLKDLVPLSVKRVLVKLATEADPLLGK